jgi:malonyl-CoA O-methyltransferase
MSSASLTESRAIAHLSTREGYDRWAEVYDSDGNPLLALEEPQVRRWLGPVAGLRVLDLGCGTGRHTHWLAAGGALVTAVDFSEGMLRKARMKVAGNNVAFVAHDLHQPLPFCDGAFDRIVCGLVLDHVEDLGKFFRESRRLLQPHGLAVFSVMHPALMLRGVQARFYDPISGVETRPASQPHQLSDYVMAAVRGGLALEFVGEYVVEPELARDFPRAEKYLGWPLLLVMVVRSPAGDRA